AAGPVIAARVDEGGGSEPVDEGSVYAGPFEDAEHVAYLTGLEVFVADVPGLDLAGVPSVDDEEAAASPVFCALVGAAADFGDDDWLPADGEALHQLTVGG